VPACLALYYRLTIPETPRYTFDVARDIEKGNSDVEAYMKGKHEGSVDEAARLREINSSVALKIPKASWRDFISFYSNWKNGKVLLGTAGSWFLLDVAFYGLGLNSSTVLTAINYGTGPNVYVILYNLAAGNCILVCAGAIPGYWTTVALVDTVGRKPIQLMGFIALTILFIIWGFDFNNLTGTLHLVFYVLVQFFFNFGTLPSISQCLTSSIHSVSPVLHCLFQPNESHRPKRNHFHSPGGMLPNSIPFNFTRHFRRIR
jgi:MFS transporter, PHS family, inorganic phosphate transporter